MSERKKLKIGWFPRVLLVLAFLCLVYGLICNIISPVAKVAVFIWYVVAAILILWAIYRVLEKNGILRHTLPCAVKGVWWALVGIMLAYFLILTSLVLSYFGSEPQTEPEYLLILGAKVTDGKPGHTLRKRVETAADYLLEHPDVIAICSGGKGQDETISESDCIADELIRRGIPEERILREDRSTRTCENFSFSRAMIPEGSSVCIVSNNFHLFRATRYAFSNGFREIECLDAPYVGWMLPHYIVREFLAFSHDLLFGEFTWDSIIRM